MMNSDNWLKSKVIGLDKIEKEIQIKILKSDKLN